MQNKKKICSDCGKEQYIWKCENRNKYCKGCWLKRHPFSAIKPVSKKQKEAAQEYSHNRFLFLLDNAQCKAKLGCCTGTATEVHHMRGRGKYLNDQSTWLPICNACHRYLTEHSAEAIALGLSLPRNFKTKKHGQKTSFTKRDTHRSFFKNSIRYHL